MEITITDRDNRIYEIFSHISGETINAVSQICEHYGEKEDEVRYHDVYRIKTPVGYRILKKTGEREAFSYEHYLCEKGFAVPQFYGKWVDGDQIWILLEDITGEDLRAMTDELAISAADSLAQLQNHYWQEKEAKFSGNESNEEFELYWKTIQKRADMTAGEPALKNAYQLFLQRQRGCPRTLSNGDFMEFNILHTGNRVTIIDWNRGGIMPYSLDIARFVVHAIENRSTVPFYLNVHQKKLFIDRVYEKLEQKPDYAGYLSDIRLAVLNEYLERVEADEDEHHWYYQHALELAREILTESFLREQFDKSEYLSSRQQDKMYRFEHSCRVANIAGEIARQEGFSVTDAIIGGLLHDVSYCMNFKDEADAVNHGRYSAQIAHPFLIELGLTPEEVDEICYGIAIHVDDRADFEGERTPLALTIGEADNIDRFDAYRIYEILKWENYAEMTMEQKLVYVEKVLLNLSKLREEPFSTQTGTVMWQNKVDFQIDYYRRLKEQIRISCFV